MKHNITLLRVDGGKKACLREQIIVKDALTALGKVGWARVCWRSFAQGVIFFKKKIKRGNSSTFEFVSTAAVV